MIPGHLPIGYLPLGAADELIDAELQPSIEEVLTAMLAHIAGGKRYWVRAPQRTEPPFIVLANIGSERDITMRGPNGYTQNRLQVDCYAKSYSEAVALKRCVIAALEGRRGGIVQGIFTDNDGRDLPAEDAGSVSHLFRISLDFIVHHTAA